MTSDQDMDARLAAAGERWRDAHTDPARVDLAAATDEGFIPLQTDDPQPAPARTSRRRNWLVAAAAVLLVGGVATGLAVTRGGDDGPTPAGTSALNGTDWILQSVKVSPDTGGAYTSELDLDVQPGGTNQGAVTFSDTMVTGSDGAHAFAASYTASGDTLTIRHLAETANGATAADPQLAAFNRVLNADKVKYVLDPSRTLVLSVGSVTLSFVPASAAINQRWVLTNFAGADGAQDQHGTAYVEFDGQKVTGSDGCNTFSSSQVHLAGDAVDFGQVAITAMACPNADQALQKAFATVLHGPTTFTLYPGKLAIESGAVSLVFVSQAVTSLGPPISDPIALYGTSWTLDHVEQAGSAVVSSPARTATLNFGDDGRALSGSDGCNAISGTVTIGKGTMAIQRGISTQMACPDGGASKRVGGVLRQGTVQWQLTDGQLRITLGQNTLVYRAAK